MTTNHPEKLDEALIRPGRVDHQVAFGNATQLQVKELFERMYTNDLPRTKLILSSPSTSSPAPAASSTSSIPNNEKEKDDCTPPLPPIKTTASGTANGTANSAVMVSNGKAEELKDVELSPKELSEEAGKFAEHIPDDMFSPAEIQGFLLKRKKDPRLAVLEVGKWVEGMREVKKRGGKVVTIQ
jgi:chaperone BCS1